MRAIRIILALLLVCGGTPIQNAPLCVLDKFNAQVQQILADVMLTPEEAHEISLTFTELQDMLRTRWEGADLFVYGSLLNGLGAKTSDVDVYARIPNYNVSADKYIVEETAKLLHMQPEKYSNIDAKLNLKVPMMTFYDTAMQRYIDLSFRSYSGVESTKMIAYYLNLDKRHTPLAAIIKLWCKVHQLTGKRLAPNYSIYLMVVFYLQQNNMSPSGYEMQEHLPPWIVDNWNVNFEEIPYSIENDKSLYELLGGFFNYYSEFDFKNNCISPFAGRPVAKSDFKDLNTIPEEFALMKNKFASGENETVTLYTDMCIQEIFEHTKNTARRAKTKDVIRFVSHLKSAAKMYEEMSCDQFLRSILVKDESYENISVGKKFEVHVEL